MIQVGGRIDSYVDVQTGRIPIRIQPSLNYLYIYFDSDPSTHICEMKDFTKLFRRISSLDPLEKAMLGVG